MCIRDRESGIAKNQIEDWDAYANELNRRLGLDNQVLRVIGSKARRNPKRIVFAEADNLKILKAAQIVYDDGVGYPILLGDENKIKLIAAEGGVDIDGLPISLIHISEPTRLLSISYAVFCL